MLLLYQDESKPYSFLAFGMGGRTCLGMNMAKAMMMVFLHRLIITYRFAIHIISLYFFVAYISNNVKRIEIKEHFKEK